MKRKIPLIVVLGLFAALAPVAHAQGPTGIAEDHRSWYWGLGISMNDASIPAGSKNRANSAVATGTGAATFLADLDEHSTGLKLTLGYRFSRFIALEGGYANLGETSMNTDFRSAGVPSTSVGTLHMKYKMSGPFVDAVGSFPFGEHLAIFGRVGVSYTTTKADISGDPVTLLLTESEKSESKLFEKFGAGIDYNVIPAFTIRLEYERYKAPDPLSDDKFNVDAATFGFLYRF